MIELAVGLTDKVSGPASGMARSMLSAQDRVKALTASVKGLERAMLKAHALGDSDKLSKLADQHGKLSGALTQAKQGQNGFTEALSGMTFELGPAIGVLAAYGAVLGGVVVGLFEGGKIALAAAQFKHESLMAFSLLSGSAQVGKETLETIRALEKSVPETEATLVDRAKGLIGQGLDPAKLKGTLQAISNVSAIFGDAGANKITGVIEKTLTQGKFKLMPKSLVGTGVNEAELAKQLGMTPAVFEAMMKAGAIGADKGLNALQAVIDRKMGGAAAEKVNTLEGLWNKFRDSISHLFEDVNVKPFLEGLKGIVQLFDTSLPSGRLFKDIIMTIFNAGFAKSGSILLSVKHGIQDIIITGLKLYIAMKPTLAFMKKHWSDIKTALIGVAILVGIVVGLIAIAAGIMVLFGVAILAVVAAVVIGVAYLSTRVMKAVRVLFSKSAWQNYAADIINGLIDGLLKGLKPLQAAVNTVVGIIPKAIKDKLDIHSPSRVTMALGKATGDGFAQGIKNSSSNVSEAAKSLALGGSKIDGPGGASKRGGNTYNFHAGAIQVNGADSTGGAIDLTETAVMQIFERIALKEGLAA